MARRPRWYAMVASSREEALNAVELLNRPSGRRPLEGFLIHMHLAWLYLLQAEFERDGVNYFYRDEQRPRRYVKVDGERKAWDLTRSAQRRWPDSRDPVWQNLHVTIRLRNKIEHRYEPAMRIASVGFTQALVLNYEEELVSQFGAEFSVGADVHLPVALSTFTREGVAQLVAAQQSMPARLQELFVKYRSGLDPEVLNDRRFEMRVEIVQKRAPNSDADLAVSFVREDELTDEERNAYEALERTGRVIIREKHRPVANLGHLRPTAVCELVEQAIPFKFRPSSEFPQAWKKLGIRPLPSVVGRARTRTDERYCVFDEPHSDYVYTQAFVDLLIERCQTRAGFYELIGRAPKPKPPVERARLPLADTSLAGRPERTR